MEADNEYKQLMAEKLHQRISSEKIYLYGGVIGALITYILTLNNTWSGIIPVAIILVFTMLKLKKIELDLKYLKETYLNKNIHKNSESLL
jgi:hypothetical protein